MFAEHQFVTAVPHRYQLLPVTHYPVQTDLQVVSVVGAEHEPVLTRSNVATAAVRVAAYDGKSMRHRLQGRDRRRFISAGEDEHVVLRVLFLHVGKRQVDLDVDFIIQSESLPLSSDLLQLTTMQLRGAFADYCSVHRITSRKPANSIQEQAMVLAGLEFADVQHVHESSGEPSLVLGRGLWLHNKWHVVQRVMHRFMLLGSAKQRRNPFGPAYAEDERAEESLPPVYSAVPWRLGVEDQPGAEGALSREWRAARTRSWDS